MSVRGFGWPAIVGPDGAVEVRGTRQAELLALLAARPGEVISRGLIVEEIWDGQRSAFGALRVAVNRLRQQFTDVAGQHPVRTTHNGYVLDVDVGAIDIHRYKAAAATSIGAHARGDHRAVVESAAQAHALWLGRPFHGIDDVDTVAAARAKLDDTRARLEHAHAFACLHLGDASGARTVLEPLTEREPYREDSWLLLAIALAHDHLAVEGLEVLRRFRTRLRDDLGLNPSPAIEPLEQELLESRAGTDIGRDHLQARAPRSDRERGRRHADSVSTLTRPLGGAPAILGPGTNTTTVLGRNDELAQLDDLVRRCEHDRELVTVDVVGEAGIGKTALVRSWLRHQHAQGRQVRYGTAGPEGAIPFEAVLQAMPDGLRGDWSASAVSRAVLLDRLIGALSALAAERTVILALEDAHFFDLATVAFTRHLTSCAESMPVLVVRTFRPVPPNEHTVTAQHRIELAPLSGDEIADIARSVSPAPGDARVADIVELAAGHPGFAIELAHHAELQLPRTALELASQRRAAIDGLSLDLVDLVAIAGRPLDVSELAELVDETPPIVALAAARALEQRVLVDHGGLAFAHDLYRSGTLQAVPELRRRALHSQFAHHLRRRANPPTRECAQHALAAGDVFGPGLCSLVAEAAVGAAFGVEPEAALKLCERIPDTPPRTPDDEARIALARGISGESLGHGIAAHRELGRALELARSGSDHRLLTEIVFAHKLFGVPIDDVLPLLTEAVLPALDGDVEDLWRLRAVWGMASYAGDDIELALDMERRGAEIAVRVGTDSARSIAAHTSVVTAFICGRPAADREELATEGLRLAADGGDPLLEYLHLGALASARMAQGDLAGTLALHDRLFALPATQALAMAMNLIDARAASVLTCQGRFDEADEAIHDVLDEGIATGRSDAPLTFAAQLFVLRWMQGRLPELLVRIEEFRAFTADFPANFEAASALCHATAGDAETARRVLDGLDREPFRGRPDLVTIGLATSARWILDDPVDPSTAAVLEPFRDEHAATDMSSGVTFGPVKRTLGLLAALDGDSDRGRALLTESHADCTEQGHVAFARLVDHDLALLNRRASGSVATARR